MAKKIPMLGQRYGRLIVIEECQPVQGRREVQWRCKCACGNEIITVGNSLRKGYTSSCGCYRKEVTGRINHDRTGSDAPNWKGGRTLDKDGYVKILVGKKTYRREHILVMEQHLGRALYDDETVHHKNGIRSDNRLDNLELRASNHGSGQTVEDLVVWAKEILARYDKGSQ